MDLLQRITRDPAVMGGRPCIRGMRVTVGTIVGLLASDRSHEEILQAYPYLEPEDIRAALSIRGVAHRGSRTASDMKVLLDMNLAPSWVVFLQEEGFEAVHWSAVGNPRASDNTIMEWARRGGYVVFTHDLDFSALLAAVETTGPSVLQVRTQDVLPESLGQAVVDLLRTHAAALEQGAIVSVDSISSRVRGLPIRGRSESG